VSQFLTVRSGYMNRAHDPKEIVEAFKLLRKHHNTKLEFDTLVGTGLSGAIVIPQLAKSLRKKFLIVRKSTDNSHSWYPAEGVLGSKWLFVDDLIASGNTLNNCVKAIDELLRNHFSWHTELTGVFLYGDGMSDATLENARVDREVPEWSSEPFQVRREYSSRTSEWRVKQTLRDAELAALAREAGESVTVEWGHPIARLNADYIVGCTCSTCKSYELATNN